jgi:hypothetical protein
MRHPRRPDRELLESDTVGLTRNGCRKNCGGALAPPLVWATTFYFFTMTSGSSFFLSLPGM